MKVLGFLLLAVPLAMAAPDRRSNPFLDAFMNVFHGDEIKTIVTDLYHSMGTDEREAECESECIKLVDTQFSTGSLNTIGHTSCPVICHSYQELVHHFDIAPSTAATSAPSKRALSLNPLLMSILNVFHADEVKTIVTDLYHSMGTDEREVECESECNKLMDTQVSTGAFNTIGHTSCPLICHSLQELVKHFDIAPAAGTSAKRSFGSNILNSILNVFHADEVKTIVTDLYHSMGTDEREVECESECNKLVDNQFSTGSFNTIGHTSCPLICHSYQELVHHFDIAPSTAATSAPATSAPAKRSLSLNPLVMSILNVFHADEVKTIVTDLYHSMGTDEREVECESECNKLMDTQFQTGAFNTIGHTSCPLICHSLQELVKHFDIAPAAASSAGTSAKRSFGSDILGSILNVFHADEVKTIVTDLYHSMGTDEREAECERECSNLIETQFHAGSLNTLGHTSCPLICHSFQELVKHYDIAPQTAAPAAGTSAAKRSMTSNLILNSILNVFHADEIKTIVTDLYHSMGTDEREAECEKECSNLIETQFHAGSLNTLGHTSCPLICHSFQELVHHFDVSASPAPTGSTNKRDLNPLVNAVLSIFHVDEIKTIVTDLYHSMGSNEREAECEKECNSLVDTQFSTGTTNILGHTSCPLVCHSFQELVGHFDLSPSTAPATGMTPV